VVTAYPGFQPGSAAETTLPQSQLLARPKSPGCFAHFYTVNSVMKASAKNAAWGLVTWPKGDGDDCAQDPGLSQVGALTLAIHSVQEVITSRCPRRLLSSVQLQLQRLPNCVMRHAEFLRYFSKAPAPGTAGDLQTPV